MALKSKVQVAQNWPNSEKRPPFHQILSKLSEKNFGERSDKSIVLFYLIIAFGSIYFLTISEIAYKKKGTKCDLPDETLEGASTTSKREAMIFQASKVDFIVLFFLVILLFLYICSKLV